MFNIAGLFTGITLFFSSLFGGHVAPAPIYVDIPTASAPIENQYWILSGTTLTPSVSTWGVKFASISPTGCVQVDSIGNLSSTGTACSGGVDDWITLSNNLYNANSGNVGVGTTSAYAKFSINNSTNDVARLPLFAIASSTASATTTLFVVNNSGNVGIGTSSPIAILDVETASSTAGIAQAIPWSQLIAQTIAGVWYKISTYDYYGHHITSGPVPMLGTCGSSSSNVGNDNNGTITVVGTAVTSCAMNFAKPWPSVPDCVESANTTASVADIASVSATSITFGLSIGINSGVIYYQCVAHQ